ncbi:MAG: hypothetical protein ACK56U_19155 [Planctomyces sp.]
MFGRIGGFLRTVLIALLLLCLLAGLAELWLRGRGFPIRTISSQVSDSLQTLLEPSGLYHHRLRPVSRVQVEAVAGRSAEIRIDAAGLRGAAPLAEKTEDDYRILVLGDELVLGAAVSEQSTLPQRLQQFLSRVTEMRLEVLNAGLPGDCPQLALLRYQHGLRKLQPDLVILHVDMSDVGDDAVYRSLLTQGADGEVCQHPALRPVAVAPSRGVQMLRDSALAGWLLSRVRQDGAELLAIRAESCGQQDYGWIMDHADNLQLQIRHALAPIEALRKCVEADGGLLLVTTCPVVWQVVDGSHCPQATRRCRIRGATPFRSRLPFQSLAAVCAESEVRFLDSSPRFLKDAEPARLFDSELPGLSERGLAFYARLIADYIVANPPQQW